MKNWFKIFESCELEKKDDGPDFINPILISEFREFSMLPRYQAVLIALYCRMKQNQRSIKTNDFISSALNYYPSELVERGIEDLMTKGWLRTYSDGTFSFEESIRLTHPIEVALRKSRAELLPTQKTEDPYRTIRGLHAIASSIRRGQKSALDWHVFTQRLVKKKDKKLYGFLQREDISSSWKDIALFVGALFSIEGTPVDINSVLYAFAPEPLQRHQLKTQLRNPNNILFSSAILEQEENYRGEITLKASSYFLGICIPGFQTPETAGANAALQRISHKSIAPVDLIFDDEVFSSLHRINSLCHPQTFAKLKNINATSRNSGIVVQLSGEPGTGKTEFCYQLARQTSRDILSFDVSQARNKYYGETEKAVKSIFDSYRSEVRNGSNFPILLFNEGDSIFQKRSDASETGQQTENTIQTILLNELEQFEGILMITTNKPDQFDPAFLRRMLYKVHFDVPSLQTRKVLLSTKCPELNDSDIDFLSERFQFSAAELNNFLKQRNIDDICGVSKRPIRVELELFLKKIQTLNRKCIKGFRTSDSK
jgi:hypothetical protein